MAAALDRHLLSVSLCKSSLCDTSSHVFTVKPFSRSRVLKKSLTISQTPTCRKGVPVWLFKGMTLLLIWWVLELSLTITPTTVCGTQPCHHSDNGSWYSVSPAHRQRIVVLCLATTRGLPQTSQVSVQVTVSLRVT